MEKELVNIKREFELQNFPRVITIINKLKKEFKNSIDLLKIEGDTFMRLGEFDKASQSYKELIEINSEETDFWFSLGLAQLRNNDFFGAIDNLEKALELDPKNPKTLFFLGSALFKIKRIEKAALNFKKAIQVDPSFLPSLFSLGVSLNLLYRYEESNIELFKFIKKKPDDIKALFYIAENFKSQKKYTNAIKTYNAIIDLKHNHFKSWSGLGFSYYKIGKTQYAIDSFKKALHLKPSSFQVHYNLGKAYHVKEMFEKALQSYKKATEYLPDFDNAFYNSALIYQMIGKKKLAERFLKKTLIANKTHAKAYYDLSQLKTFSAKDPIIEKMKLILEDPKTTKMDRCYISFSLSKVEEDVGNLEKAFDHLKEGNRLRKIVTSYSIEDDKILFSKLKEYADQYKNVSVNINNTNYPKPIFIVGMPRSGTTLVEQIISSHPKVHGAGELDIISKLAIDIATRKTSEIEERIEKLRSSYLNYIKSLAEGKQYVTDKLPQNFLFLGLICSSFPEAKIINMNRTPEAIAWSNYKILFTGNNVGYSSDLDDIVKYFNLYKNLMRFWRQRYHNRIYDLNYEKLVMQPESEIKLLIEELGLEWHQNCLFPQKNKRPLKTASIFQARNKIYKQSSRQWILYHELLDKSFNNLDRT